MISTPTPHINEPPHHIGWGPLDESKRRVWGGSGVEGGGKEGHDLRNMENQVDLLKMWG